MYFNATAQNRSLRIPQDQTSGYCGGVPEDSMHLFRSTVPGESDLPWTGVSIKTLKKHLCEVGLELKVGL